MGVVADALHTPGVTSAAEARLDDAGLIAAQGPTVLDARTGVMWGPGTTALVTGTADTAPMAYLIAPHHWITNRGVATDGVYRGALETAQRATTTAAPASGSRIDVIYAKQGDASSTISPDGSTAPIYGVVQGNSTTGTPVKPSIPVGAIELATATVSAGATATNGAGVVISNTARQTVARGARIPVRTQAERDALTAFKGLEVYRLDNGQVQLCTGTGPTTWFTTFDPAAPPGAPWMTLVDSSTTYNIGLSTTGFADLPGYSDLPVSVPVGHQIEFEYTLPRLVSANAAHLTLNAGPTAGSQVVLDNAFLQPASGDTVSASARMTGAVISTTGTVVVSVQGSATGGGCGAQAISSRGPRLRYRIT